MELAWGRRIASRTEAEEPAPREPVRLRALTTGATLTIGVLVLTAAAGLVWSGIDTRRATDDLMGAFEGQALVDAALVDLLTYRRRSDMWVATRQAQVERRRQQAAAHLSRALLGAAARADDAEERALLERAAREVVEYRVARRAMEARTRDLGLIATEMGPYVERVTDALEDLRSLHGEEMRSAYARIRRSAVLSDLVGGGLAVLFLLALVALLYLVRRSVVGPVLGLHEAIEGFRAGDMSARARGEGAREVRDVMHAYNAMADTLAAQRQGQLTYVAGVAHDLRNPLGTMKMGLSLVRDEGETESGRRALHLLDRQVDRMSRMVDDLLDASRIEAGRLTLREEIFELRERVREAVELHAPSFPRHHIVSSEPETPVVVCGDPGRIDQVLNNLLTNALKYSSEGSTVDVRVRANETAAIVEVEDRGIGMSPEELRDLFAPFRRHAPAVAPGAGLGLSIARRIVEGHGGRIEVRSQPGVGSVFRVVLPLAERPGEDECGRRPDRG